MAYDRFSYFLKKYPGQWESWLYLHKQVESSEPLILKNEMNDKISPKGLLFNKRRYGIFKIAESSYLFDRFSYVTYPIDNNLYDNLAKTSEDTNFSIETKIERKVLKELYGNQVLVSA